jgi:hypothetical protein
MLSVADSDLRRIAGVVDDGPTADPGPAMPWPVLVRSLDLIVADRVVFNEVRCAGSGWPSSRMLSTVMNTS